MDNMTVFIHITRLMFIAGHKNTPHAAAIECVSGGKGEAGREEKMEATV